MPKPPDPQSAASILVLFDGQCDLCSGAVRFIAHRDADKCISFASLQSPVGQALLKLHHLPNDLSTMIVIDNGRCHVRSAAALHIARRLRWPWPVLTILRVIPTAIRDWIYDQVARNRHRLSRDKSQCSLPSTDLVQRLIPNSQPAEIESLNRQFGPRRI